MNNLFTKIRDKHAFWYKGIIFAFLVIFCVYVLPKKTTIETTQIKPGDVWLNEDLISPFDFLIKKTSSELAYDNKEQKKQIAYFNKIKLNTDVIISELNIQSESTKNKIKTYVDSLLSIGVYSYSSNIPEGDSVFYIVENNEVFLTSKEKLLNEPKIQQFLSKRLSDQKIINELVKKIKPNVIYDEDLSKEMANEESEPNYIYKSKVEQGEIILRKNDIVTAEQSNIIDSYNQELKEQEGKTSLLTIIAGQTLACVLILGIMMLFLAFFRKTIFSQNSQVTFIFLIILLIILITSIVAS